MPQSPGFSEFDPLEAGSAFLAGEPSLGLARYVDLVVATRTGDGLGGTQGTYPTRMLNRDLGSNLLRLPIGDGPHHFEPGAFDRTPRCLQTSGFENPTASCVPDAIQDDIDALSLDSTLTWQQQGLLGCGVFGGPFCDSPFTNRVPRTLELVVLRPNAPELGVLVQSWPRLSRRRAPPDDHGPWPRGAGNGRPQLRLGSVPGLRR